MSIADLQGDNVPAPVVKRIAGETRRVTTRPDPARRGAVRQLLAPGFVCIRPEEPGPPPFLTSVGTGSGGGVWTAGACCNGTSVPWPQPIESVATNPARTARRMIRWSWNMNDPPLHGRPVSRRGGANLVGRRPADWPFR